jgi:bacterioferritin
MQTKIEQAKAALLEGLNTDLAGELQAVIMYLTYSAQVKGIHRTHLHEFFEGEIADETKHARYLARKIVALGGKPTTRPAEVPAASTIREMLQNVLRAEEDTIARYVERMKQAEALGDYGLANDLQGFIADETAHKEEAELLLVGDWQA